MPPLPRICVYLCKYTSERIEKTFPNYKFGKGQYAFYPIKLSRFAEKKKLNSSERPELYKGGPVRTGSEASLTNEKIEESIIFWGGSGHPNFMNPFEYDK